MNPNNTITNDYFENFYSTYASSPTTVCVYIVGLVTGILGPISVIWYERNCGNRFRTVINQIFSATHWYLLLYTLLVYLPDGIRFLYGPYGETFCNIHGFIQNVLWASTLLSVDTMLVLRYIFVFHMRNFAVVNDDLLARILNLSIWTISVWGYVVRRLTPGNIGMFYQMCSGMDPNAGIEGGNHLGVLTKYRSVRVIEVVSFALHLIMIPRFLYYRMNTKRNERPITLGTVEVQRAQNSPEGEGALASNQNKTVKPNNKTTSLFGLMSQFTSFAIVSGIGITALFSHVFELGQYNLEEYHWIPLLRLIYCPVIAMISSAIVVFTKNSGVRESLWRKVKSIFTTNQVGVQRRHAFIDCKV